MSDIEINIEEIEKRKIKSTDRVIQAKIEKWGSEGVTVTHDEEGKIILVRYAIPDEICKIKIYKEDKDYALGEPIEILKSSEKE